MKSNTVSIFVGILLLLVFGLLLFVYQVRKSEVAVVTTFGQLTSAETNSGPHIRMPWPIQQVYKIDERIQNFEDKYEESLTEDNYNLLTMVYVGWRVSDPKAFFPKFAKGSVQEAEKTIEGLVRTAKSSVIGKHPLSDFVSTDETQLKFTQIEGEILQRVQDQLNAQNYGIEMRFLGFKKMGFPESVTQEVFKRMTSERQVLISKTQNEGEAEATRIRSAADAKSAEMLANANAEATRIQGVAVAEAAKSFAVFQQNPELANFLLDLAAMESSLKTRATLIFDQHTQPFNLFQGYNTNAVTTK